MRKKLSKQLPDYLGEFSEALGRQLEADNERWGDTWKDRGLLYNGQEQEERFFNWIIIKYSEWRVLGTPFPWLKVAGEAMIGYIREKYLRGGEE